MSIRLYIGNLPEELDRKELDSLFSEIGELSATKVITDRKTGKCRGFGFLTVETDEQADQIIEKFNGHQFQDNALKIEKALPKAKKDESEVTPTSSSSPKSSDQRSNKNNKSRRSSPSTTSSSTEAAQPDPRWAQELEKLKQMLAAQASNS